MRILQFGKTGQLACELLGIAATSNDIVLRVVPREEADFTRPEEVAEIVRTTHAVDAVINATAYTAVDKAEAEPELARQINARSVEALARACGARHIPLVHVSTDYVFNGMKAGPYTEEDGTDPLNVYGLTKLEGEEAIRAAGNRHIILRTSWVYSAHGRNFVKTMLQLGAAREELRIVDDQHGAPTSAKDIAHAIFSVVRRIVAQEDESLFGTFHFTDSGETTWRGFAEAIFEQAATPIRARVVAISTAEYPTPARRPLNSRLDCTKIKRVYGLAPPPWRESLSAVMGELIRVQAGSAA